MSVQAAPFTHIQQTSFNVETIRPSGHFSRVVASGYSRIFGPYLSPDSGGIADIPQPPLGAEADARPGLFNHRSAPPKGWLTSAAPRPSSLWPVPDEVAWPGIRRPHNNRRRQNLRFYRPQGLSAWTNWKLTR
jgi:hypothetical protein